MKNDSYIVIEGSHQNPNNMDTIDKKTQIIHGPFDKKELDYCLNILDELIEFIDIVGPFGTLLLTGHDMTKHQKLWINTFERMSKNIKHTLSDYISNKLSRSAAE